MHIADRRRSNIRPGALTSLPIALATTLAVICAVAGLYRVATLLPHAATFPPAEWVKTPPAWVD